MQAEAAPLRSGRAPPAAAAPARAARDTIPPRFRPIPSPSDERDHPPLRRCPGIRSRRQHRLVHAVLRATPRQSRRGGGPLGDRRTRHALHRAERGAGRARAGSPSPWLGSKRSSSASLPSASSMSRSRPTRTASVTWTSPIRMGTQSRSPSRPTPRAFHLDRPQPGLRHRYLGSMLSRSSSAALSCAGSSLTD
jgi:hypothetical protein